jgi:hypothetical protein
MKYTVHVSLTEYRKIEVEANNQDEAIDLAFDEDLDNWELVKSKTNSVDVDEVQL